MRDLLQLIQKHEGDTAAAAAGRLRRYTGLSVIHIVRVFNRLGDDGCGEVRVAPRAADRYREAEEGRRVRWRLSVAIAQRHAAVWPRLVAARDQPCTVMAGMVGVAHDDALEPGGGDQAHHIAHRIIVHADQLGGFAVALAAGGAGQFAADVRQRVILGWAWSRQKVMCRLRKTSGCAASASSIRRRPSGGGMCWKTM